FLLGRHATAGQEPPTHCRSTTATRLPERARCQASSLPPCPLPRINASNRSGLLTRLLRLSAHRIPCASALITYASVSGVSLRSARRIRQQRRRESRQGPRQCCRQEELERRHARCWCASAAALRRAHHRSQKMNFIVKTLSRIGVLREDLDYHLVR